MADVDKTTKAGTNYDDSDFDDLDSSDDDEKKGPPPMLNIERGSDFNAMKSALLNASDTKPSDKEKSPQIDMRVGKENLTNLTSTFEEITKGQGQKISAASDKPVVVVDKEQYSSFKEKFENIDKVSEEKEKERKSLHATEIHGLGSEELNKAKDKFENLKSDSNQNAEKQQIEIERSTDKKLIQKNFEATDKEEPKECAVCGKIVYPVEKVKLEKLLFHKQCFNCCKCQKRLSVQNYTTHEGKLYCKLHILEIFRPEMALAYARGELPDEVVDEIDEEGEYAVVSRAKILDPTVVKSGMKNTDELETIGSLKNKKSEWAKSAEQAVDKKGEKTADLGSEMFEQGKVKSRLSKFVEGDVEQERVSDEEEDQQRDPNIVKSSKKKEAVKVEVGAKSIKGKWESGTIERAQGEMEDRSQELDEIKKNVSVKERFKEKSGAEEEEKRKTTLDENPIDTTFSHEAKERFLKGDAFQDTKPVEKTTTEDVKFAGLGSVKERFEKQPLDEKTTEKTVVDGQFAELGGIKATFENVGKKGGGDELESKKKELLEQEFKRIQEEKKRAKEAQVAEDGSNVGGEAVGQTSDDVKQCAELSSIKQRFEAGPAGFVTEGAAKKTDADLEMKVAGKARQKFKQIDQENPKEAVITSAAKTLENSKWTKESHPKPEPVNKREVVEENEGPEDDFEVKNLLSKFKNIEQGKADEKSAKPKRQITPPPTSHKAELMAELNKEVVPSVTAEELAGIKVEAKNLKAKFENVGAEKPDAEVSEEKRKQLEEEFKRLKELKESQKQLEPEVDSDEGKPDDKDADLAIAAEHGQKSRAKWEKIERKEAKKAQKAASTVRRAQPLRRIHTPVPEFCAVCTKKVYMAERFECDARLYHKPCFKCKHCGFHLRIENYATGPDGVYCKTHYKLLFNDMSQTYYDGRKSEVPFLVCIPASSMHGR